MLGDYLINRLKELKLELITPIKGRSRLSIYVIKIKNPVEISQKLLKNRIVVSVRRGGLRISIHVFNNTKDIDLLLGFSIERKDLLENVFTRIRQHGLQWSLKDMQMDLISLLNRNCNPELLTIEDQAKLIAFLISSLGHERFSDVNIHVQTWLRNRYENNNILIELGS